MRHRIEMKMSRHIHKLCGKQMQQPAPASLPLHFLAVPWLCARPAALAPPASSGRRYSRARRCHCPPAAPVSPSPASRAGCSLSNTTSPNPTPHPSIPIAKRIRTPPDGPPRAKSSTAMHRRPKTLGHGHWPASSTELFPLEPGARAFVDAQRTRAQPTTWPRDICAHMVAPVDTWQAASSSQYFLLLYLFSHSSSVFPRLLLSSLSSSPPSLPSSNLR